MALMRWFTADAHDHWRPITARENRSAQFSGYNRPVFTARCTSVQSAVLRSHVVCPSVRPFV